MVWDLPALQAIGQTPQTSAVVRVAASDPTLFKRVLDMGAQTVMVPYVQTAEEAAAAVHAMRYGPKGMRGMAGMTRATRYGKVDDYFNTLFLWPTPSAIRCSQPPLSVRGATWAGCGVVLAVRLSCCAWANSASVSVSHHC